MAVNLLSRKLQVSVGGLDCTLVAQSVELSSNQPLIDQSGYLAFTGTLALSASRLASFPEPLDPRLNPSRFAAGVAVNIGVGIGGSFIPLPMRLRILEVPARPYFGQPDLLIPIGGDFALLDYRQPEGDQSGVNQGTSRARGAIINSLLAAAGVPALVDAIPEFPLAYPVQKVGQDSFLRQAGGFAAAAGRVMWQRADGAVLAPAVSFSPAPFRVYGAEKTAEYFPTPGESPPSTITVSGVTYDLEELASPPPIISETQVEGVTVERTTLSFTGTNTAVPQTTETQLLQRGVLYRATEPGSTILSLAKRTASRETYSTVTGQDGRLQSELVEVEEPLASTQRALWGDDDDIFISERRTIDYTYNAEFIVVQKRTTIQRQFVVVFPSEGFPGISKSAATNLTTAEVITERWTKAVGSDKWVYRATTAGFGEEPRTGASTNSSAQPPATKYRPPAQNKEPREIEGSASFTPAAGSAFRPGAAPIRLPDGVAVSDAQCAAIALRQGQILQGLQWPVTWAAEITSDWLESFDPLARLDFVEPSGQRRAYLANGFTISLLPDSAAIGGNAIELGEVVDGAIVPFYEVV